MDAMKHTQKTIVLTCKCGRKVEMQLVGGQYQDSYSKTCDCGRKWLLEDLTEDLTNDGNNNDKFRRIESPFIF